MEVDEALSPKPRHSCNIEDQNHSAHKSLYKKTPKEWKDKFRKGCIQRLRQNRHKLVEKLRCTDNSEENTTSSEKSQEFIDELMNAEFDDIKQLSGGNGTFCTCCFNENDDDDDGIENILKIMDEIREELIKEEQAMLQEYDELTNFDENYLCAAIECLGTDYVICPICKRNQLLQNKQIFFCACGLRIDTGYDGTTLAQVKKQIEDAVKQHGQFCADEPVFSVFFLEELELHNLVLKCKTCNAMEIIV